MHFTNQVVGLHHSSHTISQTQSNSHWQTFWYRNNHKCYCNHQGIQRICNQLSYLLTRHQSIMEINYHTHQYHKIANDCWNNSLPTPVVKLFNNHPEEYSCRNRQCQNNRTPIKEHHQLENNDKGRKDITQLGYQVCQSIQLFI